MIGKVLLLGSVALSTTFFAPNEPAMPVQEPVAAPEGESTARLEARLRALQQRFEAYEARTSELLDQAIARAEDAEARCASLTSELDECWIAMERNHDRNCTPSRASLVRFRRYQESGETDRSERLLDQMVEQIGGRHESLNSFTWSLLTERRYGDENHDLAFALARRMLERPEQLTHYMIDTIALAHFEVGHVDEAIALQEQAIERGGRRGDYLERLQRFTRMRDSRPAERPIDRLVVSTR